MLYHGNNVTQVDGVVIDGSDTAVDPLVSGSVFTGGAGLCQMQ